MNRVRPGGEKSLDRLKALGDPRARVEQAARIPEGLKVDLDGNPAQVGEPVDRHSKEALCLGVAEELELRWPGHAEAEGRREFRAREYRRPAVGVGSVGP